mmetsp:Transcript_41383/g.103418  ORF Transcript_41383/g.103418 Transcript_41383/m.103418 type:complete len:200 (+) Transcript_41383:1591-2190(+)
MVKNMVESLLLTILTTLETSLPTRRVPKSTTWGSNSTTPPLPMPCTLRIALCCFLVSPPLRRALLSRVGTPRLVSPRALLLARWPAISVSPSVLTCALSTMQGMRMLYAPCFLGAKCQKRAIVSLPLRIPSRGSTLITFSCTCGTCQAKRTGTPPGLRMLHVLVETAPIHVGLICRCWVSSTTPEELPVPTSVNWTEWS